MQDNSELPDRYVSLRFKLLVGYTLIFATTFAVAFFWFYRFTTDEALERITEDLVATMLAAAEGIDGDQLRFLYEQGTPREDGYTDDPRYWEQVEWLATVNGIEPRAMLYTYVAGDEPGELIFITSHGAATEPQFGATFRESWITDNAGPNLSGLITTTLQAENRTSCVYGSGACKPEPYEDDWGQWVSAFTPVKNSQGDVVAALGVDFRADYVKSVQDSIRNQTLLAFLIAYTVLFLLVYFLSGYFAAPIIHMTRAAVLIGKGDYEGGLERLKVTSSYHFLADESTRLSRVFADMVGQVYQRERTLRKQVEFLKIEIDEAKRQQEVGEIVETDFFRDLQQKAHEMRERRNSTAAGQGAEQEDSKTENS